MAPDPKRAQALRLKRMQARAEALEARNDLTPEDQAMLDRTRGALAALQSEPRTATNS